MAPSQLASLHPDRARSLRQRIATGDVRIAGEYVSAYVRSIIERFRAQTTVMSQNEIIRPWGFVRWTDLDGHVSYARSSEAMKKRSRHERGIGRKHYRGKREV